MIRIIRTLDVTVYNGGSIFNFELHTQAAKDWVAENAQLESWQWTTLQSFAVEHRYAHDLAAGMIADGLAVN